MPHWALFYCILVSKLEGLAFFNRYCLSTWLYCPGVFSLNVIFVCLVQFVSSSFNVLNFNALIVLHLYFCYSGINAGEIARQESGGECDGFRVPAACRLVA